MEYILNETSVKTTNSFKMNDIKVNLDINTKYHFHEYVINKDENITIDESVKKDFKSRIGLNHDKYKELNININEREIINKPLEIEYGFNKDDSLIDIINLNVKENVDCSMLISYKSNDSQKHFHNGVINILGKDNSKINVTIINDLNENSDNLIEINSTSSKNSNVIVNVLDLNGKNRIYNANGITNKLSSNEINTIYIGKKDNLIDINYNYINLEPSSINNIYIEGILDDNSKKSFKGTIDFKKGSINSIGKEKENCLLLSDAAISKSLPIMLCHEEDVSGEHAVSSGNINEDKLFYMMSHGLSEKEAKKMIIASNMNKIISKIPEEFQEDIWSKVNNIL